MKPIYPAIKNDDIAINSPRSVQIHLPLNWRVLITVQVALFVNLQVIVIADSIHVPEEWFLLSEYLLHCQLSNDRF